MEWQSLTIFIILCTLGIKGSYISDIQDKYLNPNTDLTEDNLVRDMHDLCALFMGSGIISPKVTDVELQLRTNVTKESFPLSELHQIVTSENFDKDKKLVIYISGWLIGLPRTGQKTVENAYHVRKDTNFVATDSTHFFKTIYKWSFFTIQEIGQTIAQGLAKLIEETMYPLENVHIIGHSLGVHIAGNVGRYFKQITGKTIPRITGLDPANGCFNVGDNLGLQLDNADFIDIIHTNIGTMGGTDAVGNVDFYVGGLNPIQPGCRLPGCSHIRACDYYAESVHPNNANNFLSVPCPSINEVNADSCKGSHIPMGYKVPHTARGIYYLEVNSNSPYGKNDTYSPNPGDESSGHNIKPYNMIVLSFVLSICWFLAGTFSF